MAEINSNDMPSQDDNSDATTSAAVFMDKEMENAAVMIAKKCKLLDPEYNEKKIPLNSEPAWGVTKESPTITSIAEPVDENTHSKQNYEDDVATNVLIDLLINENKQLQKRVRLAESTVEFVMSKLRRAITYLLDPPDKNLYEKQAELLKLQKDVDQQTVEKNVQEVDLRREVMELLLSAARIEDSVAHEYDEVVTRLRLENQGLRKMLLIASEFTSPCVLTSADKSVQMDEEELYEVLSDNDGSYHTARSVYFGSDENAEDCEENNDNDSLSSYVTVVELNEIKN